MDALLAQRATASIAACAGRAYRDDIHQPTHACRGER